MLLSQAAYERRFEWIARSADDNLIAATSWYTFSEAITEARALPPRPMAPLEDLGTLEDRLTVGTIKPSQEVRDPHRCLTCPD